MRILALLLSLLAVAAQAQTNVLTDNVASFGQAGRTNLTLTLTLVQPRNRYNIVTHQFISNDPLQTTTDTSGNFSFTNICYGFYRFTLSDSTSSAWPIQVWPDTMGTTNLGALVNWAVLNPPNNWSNYYNVPQINALLASATAGAGTNVTWGTSTNSYGTTNARPANIFFINPTNPPPYNTTNYPHAQFYFN